MQTSNPTDLAYTIHFVIQNCVKGQGLMRVARHKTANVVC